jgi:putative nucleotidyltransferase with HDIG domain
VPKILLVPAGPVSAPLPRDRTSLAILVGLGVVLATVCALALVGALKSRSAAADAGRSGDFVEAYLRAGDAFSTEDLVEDMLEEAEDPASLRARLDAAARDFERSMATLAGSPAAADRRLARRAEPLHREYTAGMRAAIAAVADGDEDRAEEIKDERSDPAQDKLQPLINGTGPEHAVAQLAELDRLERRAAREAVVAGIAVPVSAIVFGLLVMVFVCHRRRLEFARQGELAALRRTVHTDALTELPNERALHRDLHELPPGTPLAVLDVVGLSRVNREGGYLAGDDLLRSIAVVLRDAAPHARVYRAGGDRFVVAIESGSLHALLALTDRVGLAIRDRHDAGLRAGIAVDEVGVVEQLRRADVALVAARSTDAGVLAYAPDLEPSAGVVERDTSRRALALGLARAVDAKDAYTRSHCETVATVAALVAAELGLAPARVARIRLAGLLHDVGKIGIPDAILNKPGRLTSEEWDVMRRHSALGADILRAAGMEEEAHWVRHHHERIDGHGYPDRLAGDAVPLESRIILVSDTFEAITATRPYREARSAAVALDELRRHAGTQFDSACVAAVGRLVERGLLSGAPRDAVAV